MLKDIAALTAIGIDGFVFGALTACDSIDVAACRKIITAASPLPVTFHRAFDDASDPLASLGVIRDLGFRRLLTSGQRSTALEGRDLINQLVVQAKDDIIIMPGAGVTEKNIASVRDTTGAREFHGSAKRLKMQSGVRVGSNDGVMVTDVEIVRAMVTALKES